MHFMKISILSYSKRAHNLRAADDIQLENEWVTNTNSHTAFDNPTFGQDPTYDSISKAKGGPGAGKNRQSSDDDGSNGISNPIYDVANDGDHGIENPEQVYAVLEKEQESDLPHNAEADDDNYEKIEHEEESRA